MELKSLVVVAVLASGWVPGFAAQPRQQPVRAEQPQQPVSAQQPQPPAPAPQAQPPDQKPQAPTADQGAQAPRAEPRRSVGPIYRMDLTISEMEGKVKANSRSYSLLAKVSSNPAEREAAQLRVGSRVPIAGEKGPTFMNVGVNIDISQLGMMDDALFGVISLEVSSLAPSEDAASKQALTPPPGAAVPGAPVTRTLSMRAPFSVTPGKPTIIGLIDDVNSPRKFQVELTATRQ